MIFITSLIALIFHHYPPSPSLVLHPQIRHTQPGSVKIVSSLVLSLVLSPFHYNHLLPAPPLPLMHGKPWSSFKFLVIQEIAYSCSVIHRDWVSISCRYYFINQLICSILTELGVTLPTSLVIYCDNVGATYLCCLSFATWNMWQLAITLFEIKFNQALFVLLMFPQQINLSTVILNRFHEVASKNYESRLTSPLELHLVGGILENSLQ